MMIMGLDLSLRGPAAVIIPANWVERQAPVAELRSWRSDGGALGKDANERDRARRDDAITTWIWRLANDHGVEHAFIEDYAFSMNLAGATDTRELGGVVRHKLVIGLGVDVERVTASAARKHMLGRIARGSDMKKVIEARFAEMGIDLPTHDERDALVTANYGLALLGKSSFMAPEERR